MVIGKEDRRRKSEGLGLYLSVPFCRSKCTFCNFASGVYPTSHHGRYVKRVCEELRGARTQAETLGLVLPETVDSVYLGGGTPSVLSPELLRELFAGMREAFVFTDDAEITMEAAPGQIDDAVLAEMVACGVNRVSLGVQSFVDREAATSGRLHTREIALRDVDRLRAAGIGRLSIDLIAGLAHQTMASWRESVEGLLGTGVEHASVYMLEVDDESRLGREMLDGGGRYHAGAVPKDDTIAAMFEEAAERLGAAGLLTYELSNFAVMGRESKHNLKYWRREPYLGIGLDAHSMLARKYSPAGEGRASRFGYNDDLEGFLSGAGGWELDHLSRRAELEEEWFLGLRLAEGVNPVELAGAYGAEMVNAYLDSLGPLAAAKLVTLDKYQVRLTGRGKLLSNEVFQAILNVKDELFCQMV